MNTRISTVDMAALFMNELRGHMELPSTNSDWNASSMDIRIQIDQIAEFTNLL